MHARTHRWSTEPVEPDVVWLGDSITRGWRNGGWRVWRRNFSERPALNLGVPGDRTADLARRLERGLLTGLAPRVVVVNIGTNDLDTLTAEELTARIVGVCRRIEAAAPSAHVLVLGIFPRGPRALGSCVTSAHQVNRLLATRLRGPRAEFLDLGQAFLDERGQVPREVMPDGLHLSSVGYDRWAWAIDPTLRRALATPRLRLR
jgi:lysophospholipase L1-like esterase